MKKAFLLIVSLAIACLANSQFVVEWDKIVYWAGEGPNKAALLVQFDDGKAEECYVWGYRWDPSTLNASGEDMFRTVATECSDLLLFTQYTGWMGNTVCGIGLTPDIQGLCERLGYDFESAAEDDNISFDYWTPNDFMGQTIAPGSDALGLCEEAISMAAQTHIIDHPINARDFGYAAYDYDWWQPKEDLPLEMRWHAGWYEGYWSYWVGGVDSETLSYSGLGMTSRKLSPDCVDAWSYNDIVIFGGEGGEPRFTLNYTHFQTGSLPTIAAGHDTVEIFDINGRRIGSHIDSLTKGIYIMRKEGKISKISIK